jgi:hypothetical protein
VRALLALAVTATLLGGCGAERPSLSEQPCPAIAQAVAGQLQDVEQLVVEDGLFCDTMVLGPACDRPGLAPIGALTITFSDGTTARSKGWREPDGRIVIHNDRPRFNETD